jgi:hypothetical protein
MEKNRFQSISVIFLDMPEKREDGRTLKSNLSLEKTIMNQGR